MLSDYSVTWVWSHSLVELLPLVSSQECQAVAMVPRWELHFYLLASLGFHLYSFREVYRLSRGEKMPGLRASGCGVILSRLHRPGIQ